MRLTSKGRFAVTAILDLALRQNRGPVSLAEISERQEISLSYLEQLSARLRRHQIVESVRGPGGGYHLARTADRITIADIVIAVDEPLDTTRCGGKQDCHSARQGDGRRCITHDLWVNLNLKLVEYLDSVTLQDLVEQQQLASPEKHRVVIHRSDRPRSNLRAS